VSTLEEFDYEVECLDVWKVFGARAAEAVVAARDRGLDRHAIQAQYQCVLAVAGANLRIRKGEIFCIIGLSGSGKSTLLRHINRLIEPTAGEIRIAGRNINALNRDELRQLRSRSIGMVFQNMALLPHRTVRDNVVLGLELRGVARDKRNTVADEKLALVGLERWADHMPHELSGGMQQRVGLARALAADPGVLLMDEPFSALDPLIRRQLQEQFINLSAVMNKTTLFITHDIDEAIRIGNRIAIMRDGVIVQSGSAEEIVGQPANDYVASFVQGVSRLEVTRAHSLMQPWEQWAGRLPGGDGSSCPVASPETSLGELIRLSVGQESPIKVVAAGRPLGVITKDALLQGIQQKEAA
jgi:glycine betaine/proline transport system ATP-binding protein